MIMSTNVLYADGDQKLPVGKCDVSPQDMTSLMTFFQ